MKQTFYLLTISLVALLAACSDDSNTTSVDPSKHSYTDMEVDSYSQLPSCVEKREGKTAYVVDQEQGYICKEGKWVENDEAVEIKSSSSVKLSSSSKESSETDYQVEVVDSRDVKKETMTDARDGKIYKTVKIGDQVWMAENLNYDYKVNGKSYGVFYDDSLKQYGRYYDWGAAMDSAAIFSENGKGCGIWSKENEPCNPVYPVRGVCPEGWHLPDSAEWKGLFKAMDESAYAMEAVGFEEWPHATDAYGFSALPAGVYGEETLYDLGSAALFSTSTASCDLTRGGESTWWCVTVRWLICAPCGTADDGRVIANGHGADVQKGGGYLSVRCVKD